MAECSQKDSSSASGGQEVSVKVAEHYNKLEEAGLEKRTQSRIFYVRNFNNWVKSGLISEFLRRIKNEKKESRGGLVVLDLCSGKGGDLLKWKIGNISHLVCADIAQTSVEQCESRYKEMLERNRSERRPQRMFTAEFHTADCSKVRLKDVYRDRSTQFDLVSCQFSFHYSFESLHQADMMMQNAAECLLPGGYFIGTTPNAYELIKRLKSSDSTSFGNEVYMVNFANKDEFPLFGCKYDFHLEGVVDCPEFLVYFPLLVRIAKKHGLRLVYNKPFAEYFDEKCEDNDMRGLLGRMQALEAFPSEEGVSLMSSDPMAYKLATEAFEEQQKTDHGGQDDRCKNQKVGTLSLAEWEATTIYLVFAFQKIEPESELSHPEAISDKEPSKDLAEDLSKTAKKRTHDDKDDRDDDKDDRDNDEGVSPDKIKKQK